MSKELKRIEVGSEVYIPSLEMYGKVVHVSPPEENPEDEFCKVQIQHFFRPSDLELYDPEADREKHKATLDRKHKKWQKSYQELQEFFSKGGDAESADAAKLGYEALKSATDLWKELSRYSSH